MPVDAELQAAQRRRDLKSQIKELRDAPETEIIFRETSPQRRTTTIYSMLSGEPLPVPLYMAKKALEKLLPRGGYMFTAIKEEAPEYKLGTLKCFLHKDSPHADILEELGLAGVQCRKATLANPHSQRMHALHRHSQEWEAYQDFMEDRKERETIARQERQLEATLALARQAVGQEPPVVTVKPTSVTTQVRPIVPLAGHQSPVHCHNCDVAIEGKLADHHCDVGSS